jgi:hypothetical protein
MPSPASRFSSTRGGSATSSRKSHTPGSRKKDVTLMPSDSTSARRSTPSPSRARAYASGVEDVALSRDASRRCT